MEQSYLKTLELDKIIARAAEGCVCKEAREMLLATQPQCDPDEVRYALEQTDAINTLLIKNGSPRFGGVENVSQLAARAVKGGVLSMGELLMVAGALRNFQNLSSWYGASEHDALPISNTVAPVEDTSWMIPLTSPRYSLLTGTTYRPLRMETTLSCRYLEVSILRTMLSKRSRMLFSVARIFLRRSFSV